MPKPNGAQIRRRRQERGLTTAELAARVGFRNEGSMRNIENRNDSTAMIKLYRIARELGVAVDEIIAAEDGEAPDGEPLTTDPHCDERYGRVRTVVARLPASSGDRG